MKSKRDKRTNLEKEIDTLLDRMNKMDPTSDDYAKLVKHLDILAQAKAKEKSTCVSPDTIAIIVGNLVGILLIIGYEKANVISSKALGFVLRGRV